jgi:hypothetical protein
MGISAIMCVALPGLRNAENAAGRSEAGRSEAGT